MVGPSGSPLNNQTMTTKDIIKLSKERDLKTVRSYGGNGNKINPFKVITLAYTKDGRDYEVQIVRITEEAKEFYQRHSMNIGHRITVASLPAGQLTRLSRSSRYYETDIEFERAIESAVARANKGLTPQFWTL